MTSSANNLHLLADDLDEQDGWITDALDYDTLTRWIQIWPLDPPSSRPVGPDRAPASGGAQPQTLPGCTPTGRVIHP